jgi:hypothetical protein
MPVKKDSAKKQEPAKTTIKDKINERTNTKQGNNTSNDQNDEGELTRTTQLTPVKKDANDTTNNK